MTRDGALLVLLGLANDAYSQLARMAESPELTKHSPHHVARLNNLVAAMRIAIEDVNRANEAELAQ